MTQEFHLSITSLGGDRYLIRTEDMADGVPVAETQVSWPVEDWLQQAQPAMDDPILGLLQGRSPTASGTYNDLTPLGKILYDALFQAEPIRESWSRAQGIAQNRREILRLRLGFKDSRLQRLPWELLRGNGHPLTTRTNLTFARYAADLMAAQAVETLPLPKADQGLRVLMVIASPDDQTRLNLRQEVAHIRSTLSETRGQALPIEMTVLEQPDRSALTQALEQGQHQILHYAGHSTLGNTGGALHLVNRQTGLTEQLTGEDLAGLLFNNSIYLAVFNSCRSGHTAADDAEIDWRQQNLLQALIHRGVPSVIAMAEQIPDGVAMTFTQLLYKNIRRGYPIDLSVSRARQGLVSAYGSSQHYWVLPILYLQPGFDGYLTQRDRDADAHLDPWAIVDAGDDLPRPPAVTTPPPQTGDETSHSDGENFETAGADSEAAGDDAAVAHLVQQLSQPAPGDEAPMPAAAEEVLLPEERHQGGLDIYETLPENPSYTAASADATDADWSPKDSSWSSQPAHTRAWQRRSRPSWSAASFWAWLLLGLVGLAGVLSLGIFALRRVAQSPPPPELPVSADNAEQLLRSAEAALLAQEYREARQYLMRVLDPAVYADELDNPTDEVLTLVQGAPDPNQADLQFVRGRAHWQAYIQLAIPETSVEDQAARNHRKIALAVWENYRQQRSAALEGHVALGFAYQEAGQLSKAIEAWEYAVELDTRQRIERPEQANDTPFQPVVLHAYAGLAMAYSQMAAEDLDDTTADMNRALAESFFSDLRRLDQRQALVPDNLAAIQSDGAGQYNWLWTPDAEARWRQAYLNLAETTAQ